MESQITTNFWGQDSDKAFRYLYDKYASTLRYFSAKYVDDDATIEDVVQDAFLNLWEKRNEFKTESTIKAYLYKIVRSFSVDTIRRRNIANRYAEKIVLEKEDQEFFLENIVESEVFQMIQTVFNELSPSCREVYQLSLHGKSHEEISQLLDISINTVKKHKNNANHYMRERLKHVLSILLYI
ncbi:MULTISPECIES: RNA polymerase sigma-70 factor [Butyricimonas]|jgi:RNA polymerase sigma-70 factor|uniref:RNA polymerase sigma-70 factor (ECF subfamily) n=1 Tax=Butyricimonas faecihominis TaxID=1472416 RepID=A0A7W6HT70_9BACT|nr:MULTISPECIES: RNA polymerase sigma-70 factor [Butyricimonas]MBS6688745.1 RNA polymerase sigma-70 factor [Sanguibacteroides justesenii]KAB1509371.1 RNA polymerase sigma-70 factor [Butyricimonas faecihominis]MBB4024549.1 RNA polymerase sigma-70 factor (ECF subfamily) [Butyricimonas faecihominis]WOF08135.1 RNA polymerase sigma-70 factor [Butyricimonas faecihominis]BEI55749.1 RNA polymerase sigma-70 factor [Butyricimonas faecihominis]